MTPAYYDKDHMLLRAQLRCLSEQTCREFDVWLIDAHYARRKDIIPQFAEQYRLNLIHIPYRPNTHVAKRMDCAVFNAVYCYAQTERIVRFSCWRFVRPTWVAAMLECPRGVNMDMDFLNVRAASPEAAHPETGHNTQIWNYDSDEVYWDQLPKKSGDPGACWSPCSDNGPSPIGLVPLNCYGNIMWQREQWLALNGTDEVFTNLEHFEDLDFCVRAANARQLVMRAPHLMYRLDHHHGTCGGYANVPTDWPFRPPCAECVRVNEQALPPIRYDIARRAAAGEIELFPDEGIWVCKTCLLAGSMWNSDPGEFMSHTGTTKRTQARIIPKYKIGRNLRILAEDMDRLSLADKVNLYNRDSWIDPRYYNR